jgi:hypothetical protein
MAVLDLETINEVRFWEGKQPLILINGSLFIKEEIDGKEVLVPYHFDDVEDEV